MPLFEYICKECENTFERIVPRHDSPADCPQCHSQNVEKQLSVFAVASAGPSQSAASDTGCGRCGAAAPGMCGMAN